MSDSALENALKGKDVTIVEMLDDVAVNDHFINRTSLIRMLAENNVKIYSGHKVTEINENGIKALNKEQEEIILQADTIIASFGMAANTKVANEINEKYHNKVSIIGDSKIVGKVGGAVRSGMYAAMRI